MVKQDDNMTGEMMYVILEGFTTESGEFAQYLKKSYLLFRR